MKEDNARMDDPSEPMERELSGLLRRGAPGIEPESAARERVFARLAGVLPLVGSGGGPGGGPPTGSGTSMGDGSLVGGGKMLGGAVFAKLVAPLTVGLALGGGAGAIVTRAMIGEKVRIVYVD